MSYYDSDPPDTNIEGGDSRYIERLEGDVDRAIAAAEHRGRLEGAQAAVESFYVNERAIRGRRGWRILCEGEAARIVAELEDK